MRSGQKCLLQRRASGSAPRCSAVQVTGPTQTRGCTSVWARRPALTKLKSTGRAEQRNKSPFLALTEFSSSWKERALLKNRCVVVHLPQGAIFCCAAAPKYLSKKFANASTSSRDFQKSFHPVPWPF